MPKTYRQRIEDAVRILGTGTELTTISPILFRVSLPVKLVSTRAASMLALFAKKHGNFFLFSDFTLIMSPAESHLMGVDFRKVAQSYGLSLDTVESTYMLFETSNQDLSDRIQKVAQAIAGMDGIYRTRTPHEQATTPAVPTEQPSPFPGQRSTSRGAKSQKARS